MATWVDSMGDTWSCEITVATMRAIKRKLSVDLLDPSDTNIGRVIADVSLLVDILWECCVNECKERNIDGEGFASRLAGDSIAQATRAMLEALADFFPYPQQREAMRRKIRAVNLAIETADAQAAMRIGNISGD